MGRHRATDASEGHIDVTLFDRPLPEDIYRALLGRHQVHDPRSRAYAVPTPASLPTQQMVHRRYTTVWDQGRIGSCTAAAALSCLMTGSEWRPGRVFSSADVPEFYHRETLLNAQFGIDGVWPPTDTGSCFLASAKVLQNEGLITGYQHAFSLNAALDALSRGPICVGIPWYDSMLRPRSDGLVTISPNAAVIGGHEICVSAIYPQLQLVGFPNSWGPSWGRSGYGFLHWDVLGRLLDEGGDVGVFVR